MTPYVKVHKSVAFLRIFLSSSIPVVRMDLVNVHLPGSVFFIATSISTSLKMAAAC